jgi:hypothetical protein
MSRKFAATLFCYQCLAARSAIQILPAVPAGVVIVEVGGNITNSSTAWAWYARANEPWASTLTSFALWGGGTFASYAWGRAPYYTADYACQGGLIAEKLLAHGGASDRAVLAVWLATLPMNNDGKAWEAQVGMCDLLFC